MSVPRGTTPTFDLVLTGADLSDTGHVVNVYATFSCYGKELTKTGEDLEITVDNSGEVPVSTVSVFLSQEETLQFSEGKTSVQVNWTYPDGVRASSEIKTVSFSKQLLDRVVE